MRWSLWLACSVRREPHIWTGASFGNRFVHLYQPQRQYARPANLDALSKAGLKPPPPPPSSRPEPVETPTVEDGHAPGEIEQAAGPFDDYLARLSRSLRSEEATSVSTLYQQYHDRGGRMCQYIIPYDERPVSEKRADFYPQNVDEVGDGLVMVVHAHFKPDGRLDKVCACSGFVVDTQPNGKSEGQVVITCAHTLEEMRRMIQRTDDKEQRSSLTFIIPSHGEPRRVQQILSSMPRSDVIAMQLETTVTSLQLRALPLSPFPVYSGTTVLTHLFGASSAPEVTRSQSRLPPSSTTVANPEQVEKPVRWLNGNTWRRWGAGTMLGYRSYTNIEVEAGIHSSLPHILTSILPTSGSSGGPLVSAESGAVVGMISGRRMDNRVEGERGWGASSESIYEMFSLPGFTPSSR